MTTTTGVRTESDAERSAGTRPVRVLAGLLLLGVGGGALTSVGQGHLPDSLNSLANSATPWVVLAYVAALPVRRAWWAASAAVLAAFVLLLLGYEVADQVRGGFGMAPATWVYWMVTGAMVALPVGFAAWAVSARPALGRILSVGLLGGLAVAEGIYGLTVVAASTSPVWWTISIVAGVAGVVWLAATSRDLRQTGWAVLGGVVTAGLFFGMHEALAELPHVLSFLN